MRLATGSRCRRCARWELTAHPSILLLRAQGPRVAAGAGLAFGAVAAAGSFLTRQLSSRGMLKSFL